MMKKTMLVMAMAIALAMSTMAGAFAKNAPGHEKDTGTVQGSAEDPNNLELGEVDYLFNKAGYHFWFTANADLGRYDAGNSYHNVYKYSVDDLWNWCGPVEIPDREPYNAGGTAGDYAYYKIWNVTTEEWVCGRDNAVATGTLDSADADGIAASIPEGQDGTYELKVSGTWQNGPWWLVDAVCVEQGSTGANTGDISDTGRVWLRTWDNGNYTDPPFGDVLADGVSPWTQTDSDCPDPDHTYTTSVTVTGGSVDLQVYDSTHSDNTGVLNYTLTRIG